MPPAWEMEQPLFWSQFKILMWKNLQIKKNYYIKTFIEITIPLIMVIVLIILRILKKDQSFNVTEIQNVTALFNQEVDWPWTFYVAPNLSEVQSTMKQVLLKLNESKVAVAGCKFFASSTEIDTTFLNIHNSKDVGVVFSGDRPGVSSNFTLRFSSFKVPSTTTKVHRLYMCRDLERLDDCPAIQYFTSGFSFLQFIISSVLLKGPPTFTWNPSMLLYPIPGAIIPSKDVQQWGPVLLTISFAYLINIILLDVVAEKQNHIKQALLLMGTQLKAYWFATFVSQAIQVAIAILLMIAIIYTSRLFPQANYLIFFFLLLAYGFSTITLAFALSTFFNKPQVAGSIGFVVTMILCLLFIPAKHLEGKVPSVVFYFLSLLPPLGFSFSIHDMLTAHSQVPSFYPQLVGLAILTFDAFLYGFLAFYLDHVIPGEYGAKENPFFLCKKSYWSKSFASSPDDKKNGEARNPDIEPIARKFQKKGTVQILNLTKVFSKKGQPEVKAVDGLSLTIYESQITILLGHNGAGKSTLIHMLTGALPPTSGQIWIYGHSTTSNLEALRLMLGVCLQDDVVHHSLSPAQHLHIFAGIKGIALRPEHLHQLLEELNLSEVRDTPAHKLSGGQKRKLCVGLALVGDPKVLILDEPTSGVDVASRHQIWDVLRRRKGDRVIIMTTHSMEEADNLADRNAIVSKGKLKCVGSSLFLKNRFGIGYHLNVELNPQTAPEKVIHLVLSHVSKAQVTGQTHSGLSITLPWEQASHFPAVFMELERAQLPHGITMTTLEEVFLQLGVEEEEEDRGQGDIPREKPTETLDELENLLEFTKPSFLHATKTFLQVRFLLLSRDPLVLYRILISPFIYCLIDYLIDYQVPTGLLPPLSLKPQIYPQADPLLIYNNSNDSLDPLVSNLGVKPKLLTNLQPSLANLFPQYMALNVTAFKSPQVEIHQLVNGSFVHAIPVLQSLLTRAGYGGQSLEVISHPLPPSKKDLALASALSSLGWIYILAIYLGALPVELAVECVADRETGVRSQVRAAGLSYWGYWIPLWLSHGAVGLTSMAVLLGLNMALGMDKGLHYGAARVITVVAMALCNFACLLLAYCLGHIFQRESTAMQWLPLMALLPVIFLTALLAYLVVNTAASNLSTLLFLSCLLYPFLAPMNILILVSKLSSEMRLMESHGKQADQSRFFQPDGVIMIMIYAVVLANLLYSLLLWLVENFPWLFQRHTSLPPFPSKLPPADDDVVQEEARIQTILDTSQPVPPVLLHNLHKKYQKFWSRKSKEVLRHVTLAVNTGHLFALLGPNGAGKTSLIKILVAEQRQTSGQVMIGGMLLKLANHNKIFRDLGYCPQVSGLIKNLSVEEHLTMFAAIRGIPSKRAPSLVEKLMNHVGISKHAKKWIKNLSGGTKRKVCLALSLLGLPKLLVLDEPTTGVDPQSRAFLRELLGSLYQHGGPRCLLLTTHSIEDVEALCSRVAILVKGTLRCLGTTPHIKRRFGSGYILEAKLASNSKKEAFKEQVKKLFPDARVQDTQPSLLVFTVPHVASLGSIFSLMERAKSELGVGEYSFSQTTLEKVFLQFAKEQKAMDKSEL